MVHGYETEREGRRRCIDAQVPICWQLMTLGLVKQVKISLVMSMMAGVNTLSVPIYHAFLNLTQLVAIMREEFKNISIRVNSQNTSFE